MSVNGLKNGQYKPHGSINSLYSWFQDSSSREVGGSNPLAPTTKSQRKLRWDFCLYPLCRDRTERNEVESIIRLQFC